jgi:hypothetical protein
MAFVLDPESAPSDLLASIFPAGSVCRISLKKRFSSLQVVHAYSRNSKYDAKRKTMGRRSAPSRTETHSS